MRLVRLFAALSVVFGPLFLASPASAEEVILDSPDPEVISEPAPEVVEEEPIVIEGGSVDEEPISSESEPEPVEETAPTPVEEEPTEDLVEEEPSDSSEVQEPQPEEPTEQSDPETEQQTPESESTLEESPSEPPTVIETPGGDDMSYEVPLSAPVLFCGVEYNSIYATTNAVITFGEPDGTYWDYPETPSVSMGSQDWTAYGNREDEHFIISHTDDAFQVDMSARPFGSDPSSVTVSRLILSGLILEDRSLEFNYYLENTEQYEDLRFGVRTPEGEVQTLEEFGMQESTAAPEEPGQILTPEPEVDEAPESTEEPVDASEPEAPEEEPAPEPEPQPEEETTPEVPSTIPYPVYQPEPQPEVVVDPEPETSPEVETSPEEPEESPTEEEQSEPTEEPTEEEQNEENPTEETTSPPSPEETPNPQEEPQPSEPSESETANPEAEEPAESLEPKPEPEPSPTVTEEPTPPTEEPLINAQDILSLDPTSITDEQVSVLRGTAYQTFEIAEPGSEEYKEALQMLSVVAEADDPELPEELAAIPVVGAVAGQVLDVMNDLGNVGADMAPETREKSEKVVVAAVIVGNIAMTATQTAASAAVAAARRP